MKRVPIASYCINSLEVKQIAGATVYYIYVHIEINSCIMSESGFIYGTIVDPVLKNMRQRAASHIKPGQSVLDIACGTGAQLFEVAGRISRSVGMDYSESMIHHARKNARRRGIDHIDFMHHDATLDWPFNNNQFDVAMMSLALHQFAPEHYHIILKEMKRVSQKQIVIDYAIPLPRSLFGAGSRWAEFLAGGDHYRNFKRYSRAGGLVNILEQHRLEPRDQELFAQNVFHLIVCS